MARTAAVTARAAAGAATPCKRRRTVPSDAGYNLGGASRGLALVLVGPEGRGKDVLIAAARRRFACDQRLAFPLRVMTRQTGAIGEHLHVSRRVFREMERERSFLVSWTSGDHGFALPAGSGQLIEEGRIVVVAGTAETAERLAAGGTSVRVVTVNAGPDLVRARLAAGARARPYAFGGGGFAHEISHSGNLADAVRRFHALLQEIRDERADERPAAEAPVCAAPSRAGRLRVSAPTA